VVGLFSEYGRALLDYVTTSFGGPFADYADYETMVTSRPYWRRVEKIWRTRQDLRTAAVLGAKGAAGAFVREVMRGKLKDQQAVYAIRSQLAELVGTYDIIRLIGEISDSKTASQAPL